MVHTPAETLALTSALKTRERRFREGASTSMTEADQLTALQDAVTALGTAGIRCALIGGIAVGVRAGIPRATMDVDLAVATADSRSSVRDALVAAGFTLRGEHTHSINFQHRTGEPVQVAFDEAFDAVVERAEPVNVGDVPVPVALAVDLIALKERAAADPSRRRSKALRDQADVELLRGDVPDDDEGW